MNSREEGAFEFINEMSMEGAIKMPEKTNSPLGAVLAAQLEEYKALREAIIHAQSSKQQLASLATAITAGAVSIVGIAQVQPVLYLVTSLLLTAILWTSARYSMSVGVIADYFEEVLFPEINRTISNSETDLSARVQVMQFEHFWRTHKSKYWTMAILGAGETAVSLLPPWVFIVAFVYLKQAPMGMWLSHETALFFLALIGSIVLPLVIVLRRSGRILNRIGKSKGTADGD